MLLALLLCVITPTHATPRAVVTLASAALNTPAITPTPENVTEVKRYGRRLVVHFGRDMVAADSEWLGAQFHGSALSVEPDTLVSIDGADEVLPLEIVEFDNVPYSVNEPGVTEAPPREDDRTTADMEESTTDDEPQTTEEDATPWNLDDSEPYGLHIQQLRKTTAGNATVAILDSGLAAAGVNEWRPVGGFDFISSPDYSNDQTGRDLNYTDPGDSGPACPSPSWHGTRVASVVYQIAPEASMLILRVLGRCGAGFANDVTDAIVWAAGGVINGVEINKQPARIISMSFAGEGPCPSYLQSAVNTAVSAGVVLVAAAGNQGKDAAGYFPGNCAGVLSIGASTRDGRIAPYSNFGPTVDWYAPGGDSKNPIHTTTVVNQVLVPYQSTGTSFATPHVSGLFALLSQSQIVYTQNANVTCSQYQTTSTAPFNCKVTAALKQVYTRSAALTDTPVSNPMVSAQGGQWCYISGHAQYCSAGYSVDCQNQICEACSPGHYTIGPEAYDDYCDSCQPGTYAPNWYSTGCIGCPGNWFNSGWGEASCTKCPDGTRMSTGNPVTYTVGRTLQADCTACPKGTAANVVFAESTTFPWYIYTTCIGPPQGLWTYSGIYNNMPYYKCIKPGGSMHYWHYSGQYVLSDVVGDSTYAATFGCATLTALIAHSEGGGACNACPRGTYSSTDGSATCTQCSIGWIAAAIGSTACTACAAGTSTAAAGAIACTACPAGQSSTTGNPCANCLAGTYTSSTSSSSCQTCSAGSYSADRATVCIVCEAGFYNPLVTSACIQCPATKCCTAASLTAPNVDSCPITKYCPEQCSNPIICPAGYQCNAGSSAPTACSAGTYCIEGRGAAGTDCPMGSFCPVQSPTPTPCPVGTFSTTKNLASATECRSCNAGRYNSVPGAQDCTDCPQGWYQSDTGATGCKVCTWGTYNSDTGKSRCNTCEAGKYAYYTAMSACDSCPPGTSSTALGAASATVCTACAAGSYSTVPASQWCTSCDKGTYGSITGKSTKAEACTDCNAGYEAPREGMTACTPCPAGKYASTRGTRDCASCINQYSLGGASQCTSCSATPCDEGSYRPPCPPDSDPPCTRCPVIAHCTYSTSTCDTGGVPTCACDDGFELVGRACVPCADGFFSNRANFHKCSPEGDPVCNAGDFKVPGNPTSPAFCFPCPTPPPNTKFTAVPGAPCAWQCGPGFQGSV